MNNEEQRRFMTNVDIGRTLEMIGIEAKYDRGQWHAKCPNGKRGHAGEDRNPSWAIRDDSNHDMHGVHACWSCGYGGNIIGLVEDVLNLRSYQDAASWLQTHSMRGQIFAPLSVEIEVITPTIIKILDVPEGVVPLAKADYKYRSYWLKKRGFHMEDAARWQIGAWADRIWIPIYNSEGQLVNWTGRAIDDREPRYMRAPKALNPDQQVVFGEAEWRRSDALGRLPWMEVCCISEGELNAIRLASVFYTSVAALGGGNKLHPIHAAKLSRFERLVVFADGDTNGDKLTEHLRDIGRPMAVLRFSKGYDVCDLSTVDLLEHGRRASLAPISTSVPEAYSAVANGS